MTSVVNPVLYLGALGVGLGRSSNRSSGASLGVLSYLEFVAPGILAATAMTIATNEASWPVLGAIRWTRQYFAMLATPLGVARHRVGTVSGSTARVRRRRPSISS